MSLTAGIASKGLNLSDFFDHLVASSFELLNPFVVIPNSKGNLFSWGVKYTWVGKFIDFPRKLSFILEMVLDRPMVTMER